MTTKRLGSIAAVLGALALAQPASAWVTHTTPAQAANPYAVGMIPAGTHLTARLETHLSTRRSDYGDHFAATIVSPVTDARGNVLIPAGARLEGMVHTAERGHGRHGVAQMGLSAQRLLVNGAVLPIYAELSYGQFESYHTGVRPRHQARLEQGSMATFQLVQPIAVADLHNAMRGRAVGGGPIY